MVKAVVAVTQVRSLGYTNPFGKDRAILRSVHRRFTRFIVPKRQSWNKQLCCLLCSAISQVTGNFRASIEFLNRTREAENRVLPWNKETTNTKRTQKYRTPPPPPPFKSLENKDEQEGGGRAKKGS